MSWTKVPGSSRQTDGRGRADDQEVRKRGRSGESPNRCRYRRIGWGLGTEGVIRESDEAGTGIVGDLGNAGNACVSYYLASERKGILGVRRRQGCPVGGAERGLSSMFSGPVPWWLKPAGTLEGGETSGRAGQGVVGILDPQKLFRPEGWVPGDHAAQHCLLGHPFGLSIGLGVKPGRQACRSSKQFTELPSKH